MATAQPTSSATRAEDSIEAKFLASIASIFRFENVLIGVAVLLTFAGGAN